MYWFYFDISNICRYVRVLFSSVFCEEIFLLKSVNCRINNDKNND